MKSPKTLLTLGIVLLSCGISFRAAGLATHLVALWSIGPGMLAMGVVFLAMSKRNASRDGASASGDEP